MGALSEWENVDVDSRDWNSLFAIVEKLTAELKAAKDVLALYSDQESYHAISFMVDRPAGWFADDFEAHHGHPDYKRAMPGLAARDFLKRHPD